MKKVLTYTDRKRVEELSTMCAVMSMLMLEAYEEMNDIQSSVGIVPTEINKKHFEGIKYFAEINSMHISTDFKDSTAKGDLENAILFHVGKLLKRGDSVVNKKKRKIQSISKVYGKPIERYNVFNSGLLKL